MSTDALTLSGKVTAEDGEAISGVLVFLTQESRVWSTITDEKGYYVFDAAEVRYSEIVAYHKDYALDGFSVVPIGDIEYNLVLLPKASIVIRVVNHEFRPVPGARVMFMLVNDRFPVSADALTEKGFPLLRSNDEGILEIGCIPSNGFIKLTLAHQNYAYSDVAYLPVDQKRRDIILYPGTRLRGRVTADGKPVKNARVRLFQVGVGGQRTFAETLTDSEGFYRLRAPEDHYLIVASHADYASSPPSQVDMSKPEETVTADLVLVPPYKIRGLILMPDNTPCPGTRLIFYIEDAVTEDTFSDSNGEYLIRASHPKGVLRVVPPPGFMTEILSDIPIDLGEKQEISIQPIRLKKLPIVSGQVIFPENTPSTAVYIRSLDLPTPVYLLSNPEGAFELQFFYQPEQEKVIFRVEHPVRFLRSDFVVNLKKTEPIQAVLEEFEPDLERREHEPGRNNLQSLLGKPAPSIECSQWFNSAPLSLESLKNKVVVLFLWGGFDNSRYGSERLAELRALYALLKDLDDVAIVGVHDASSEFNEIEEYINRFEVHFPVGRDTDSFTTFVNYSIKSIPQIVLIDKQGVLQYDRTENRLLELIKALRRRS